MPDRILLVDLDNCVRCFACEVACREEHNLAREGAPRWCRIETIEPRRIAGQLHMDFVPLMCFHCEEPACAALCPVDAISRDTEGTVTIDGSVCTGCELCVHGCPYGAMSYDDVQGIAGHCDRCTSRVRSGMEPACVQHCIGGALQWVTRDELSALTVGEHTLALGAVCYTSSKWRLGSPIP